MIEIRKVKSPVQIDELCNLAYEIWNEHYIPIIGERQVNYMLRKFQSAEAVSRQISEGYEYYSVYIKNRIIGYFSISAGSESIFLSKFYLSAQNRSRGYGKIMLCFIENRAKELGLNRINLTVNKYNTNSLNAYEKMGFSIRESLVQDIGEGFVMDDYVMEKELGD